MQNVPHNQHLLPRRIRKFFFERERIQQRLGRVRMRAIARIDHRGMSQPRDGARQTRCLVAHNHVIRAHGLQGFDGLSH